MGGHALKTYTRRYNRTEFDLILPEIKSKLLNLFKSVEWTKFYHNKQSFGDADFLVLSDDLTLDINQFLLDEFKTKEIVKNSNVWSFEYKELQVDLILTSSVNWESSLNYFSYNDIHNLIGKYAKKFDLKHGIDGLKYVHRLPNGKFLGNIHLTSDLSEILDLVGLDYDRYLKGFYELEDIYEYVTSSKYFNPYLFDLSNYNNLGRKRDEKRPNYNGFLKHIEKYKIEGKEYHYFHKDKTVYLGLVDYKFPGFLKQYKEMLDLEERKLLIWNKFNGNLVMSKYPELTGNLLGKHLYEFKDKIENFEDWLFDTSEEDIWLKFKEYYE